MDAWLAGKTDDWAIDGKQAGCTDGRWTAEWIAS